MSNGQALDPVTGELPGETSLQEFTPRDGGLRDDGAISMPQIGTIPLAGLTIEEAESELFLQTLLLAPRGPMHRQP